VSERIRHWIRQGGVM